MMRFILLSSVLTGCVYDASNRCGPSMTFDAALDACVCDANAISTGLGCTPCADDEVVVNGACGCPSGSAKNDQNVCARVVGLGDTCATDADCTSAQYATCAPASAGTAAGTCTNACTSDADCGSAYTCATWEAQPYCRPFAGLGKTCATSADCTTGDAKFCDTYQTHTCIVNGCSLTASDCPRGSMCCDFSNYGLGTLCAEACQ